MKARRTKIPYADYSGGDLNFIIGCTPASEGCANCYAAAWAKRCGRDFSKVDISWAKLDRLWQEKWVSGGTPYRRGPGSKPIMFPVDLGDLFHPAVDDTVILSALSIYHSRDDADWIMLTKRPERMLSLTNQWLAFRGMQRLPANIWCMTTAENQRRADERVPILLQVKAQVRGLSVEPMLEAIDLTYFLNGNLNPLADDCQPIHWVIVGAESGPNRRPFYKHWAVQLRNQCRAAGVPFFYKQSSGLRPATDPYLFGEKVQEFPQT